MRMMWIAAAALAALPAGSAAAQEPDTYARPDPAPDAAAQLAEMTELYERVCLQVFPDDKAVDAEMTRRGGVRLSEAGVRYFLHADPGVGWHLKGRNGDFDITIEAPPYHACSVRARTTAGFKDWSPYRSAVDRFEKSGSFKTMKPQSFTADDVTTVAHGESKQLSDGGREAFLVLSATPVARIRKQGKDAVEVRFVHQLASPGAR